MNVRKMIRLYVEQRPQPGRKSQQWQQAQGNYQRRSTANNVLDSMLDFEKCLNALELQERILLTLVYGAGYRYSEAAALSGCHPARMSQKLDYAETRLTALLEGEVPPPPRRPGRPRSVVRQIYAIADPCGCAA